MESTELLGMFQQRWVGVKSASFDCILVFPCRHSNGERAAPCDGRVDTTDVRLRDVNSGQLRHSKISSAFPALTPLSSSLSPAHFLYLFKKLPFFPSLFFSRACCWKQIDFPFRLSHSLLPFFLFRTRNRHHRWTMLSQQQRLPSVNKDNILSFKTGVKRVSNRSVIRYLRGLLIRISCFNPWWNTGFLIAIVIILVPYNAQNVQNRNADHFWLECQRIRVRDGRHAKGEERREMAHWGWIRGEREGAFINDFHGRKGFP